MKMSGGAGGGTEGGGGGGAVEGGGGTNAPLLETLGPLRTDPLGSGSLTTEGNKNKKRKLGEGHLKKIILNLNSKKCFV